MALSVLPPGRDVVGRQQKCLQVFGFSVSRASGKLREYFQYILKHLGEQVGRDECLSPTWKKKCLLSYMEKNKGKGCLQ